MKKRKPMIEKYKKSFQKYEGKISKKLINIMATEGINVIKLEDAYKNSRLNGVKILLSLNIC